MSGTWEPFGSTRLDPTVPSGPAPAEPAAAPAAIPSRREPARSLAILTCMDARIDPLGVLGLSLGDANVLRNAGATASDDVLRSLGAAVEKLGVVRAVVIGHTDCAGHETDAAATAGAADSARRIRSHMPDGFGVDAFMYDVVTGSLTPVP